MVNTDQDVKLLSDLGIPVVESNLPTIVRSVVANLSAAVCSRYHGLINCIVHGVPTISLGWHDKYPGVMNLVEMIEFDHPVNHDEEDLVSRLEVLSATRPALIQRLQTNVGEVRSIIRTRMSELSTHLGGPPTVLNDLVTVDDTAIECLPEPKKRKGLHALLRYLRWR
jgi:polysaccharide pyruvyl transferase WcaK-like protein